MYLSIIIPVLNEQDNIEILHNNLSSILATLPQAYEIVFVDDGSTDNTLTIINQLTQQHSYCKAVALRRNFGQTAAMMAGIEHSSGEIIIPMDGDLQNSPEDIPRLLEKIEQGFDVVSGWRKDRKDKLISRKLPSWIANAIISKISGVKLHDYGCSLKAYRRDVLEEVKLYGEMHRFIPIYASWAGAKITELPVTHYPRIHGESNYGIGRTFKVVLDLLVVKFLSDYSHKPIYIFGGFGLFNFTMSFLVFFLMLYYKYFDNTSFISTPLPLIAILFFLMGFLSILLGFIAEILTRTYYESQNKPVYLVAKLFNFKKEDP